MNVSPCTLVIDWTNADCTAAIIQGGRILGRQVVQVSSGARSVLPNAVAAALGEAQRSVRDLGRVVVVTGPGSFTAIRTAVAYAQGLAVSLNVPIVGVTAGGALRSAVADTTHGPVWVASHDRLGRVVLDRDDRVQAFAAADIPVPAVPVTITGEAAADVAGLLRAGGATVTVIDRSAPTILEIASAAARMGSEEPALPVRPLYVEAPAVTVYLANSRPAPVA